MSTSINPEQLSMFDNMISNITIPSDIKNSSIPITNYILSNNRHNREDFMESLESISRSIKIEPLSFVDERKYYSYIDGAYYMYNQLIEQSKMSNLKAWIISNLALLNWYFKSIVGQSMTGLEVEKQVDSAIRSPIMFSIANCLMSSIKISAAYKIIDFATSNPNTFSSTTRIAIFGYLIISISINMIKLLFKLSKKEDTFVSSVKKTTPIT